MHSYGCSFLGVVAEPLKSSTKGNHRSHNMSKLVTFGELKVGRKRGLVDLDQEEMSLGDGSQQELDGDAQLVDRLLEADGRRRGLAQGLGQMLGGLGVLQL